MIIVLMGLLSFALALISGSIHRDLVFENQRAAMNEMISVMVHKRLKELSDDSQDLGLSLQSLPAFKQAIADNDTTILQEMLNNQFHQYFVTAGIIKLKQLILLDTDYSMIVEATEGDIFLSLLQSFCPQLFIQAQARTGSERMKTLRHLCLFNNRPIYAVVVPVGGLRLKGYIMVITDFVHNIKNIESDLSLPLSLRLANNEIVFQSPDWTSNEKKSLISTYNLSTPTGTLLISATTSQNMDQLTKALKNSRFQVLIITGTATFFIVLFSIFIIRNTMLNPLNLLVNKFRVLHTNQSNMDDQLKVTGTKEIHEIIGGFNEMSLKLNQLYNSLEHIAYTDTLTKLPNRLQFQESLENFIQLHDKINKTFSLFLIDLNRFKEVNDTFGHHTGDELLKEVSLRLHNCLRDGDIVTQLDQNSFSKIDKDMIARLGGDEFSVILTSIHTAEDATLVAKKLIEAMKPSINIDGNQLKIGLSIGIAMYPQHGDNIQALLNHADIAMYNAKTQNTGFSIYEPV